MANTSSPCSFTWEAWPRQLEQWYVGHAVELVAANVSATDLRATTAKLASTLAVQAGRVFADWLRQIEQTRRLDLVKRKRKVKVHGRLSGDRALYRRTLEARERPTGHQSRR